jgi:hypothetical protein
MSAQGEPRHESLLVRVGAEEVELHMYTARSRDDGAAGAVRNLAGVLSYGDRCAALLAWYPIPLEARALEALHRAFASLRILGDVEHELLVEELARTATEPNLVGDGYSLRSGTYRDFRLGLRWVRPGNDWELGVGEEAAQRRPDAILTLYHPELDLRGYVIPTPVQPISLDEAHGNVLAAISRATPIQRVGKPERVELGERVALLSSFDATGGAPTRHVLATTENDNWAFQVQVSGPRAIVAANMDAVREVIAALEIEPSPSSPTFVSGVGFYDDRMGYELRSPAPSWTFDKSRANQLWPAGSLASWEKGDDLFAAFALHGAQVELGPRFHASVLRNSLPERVGKWIDGAPTETRNVAFEGQDTLRIDWRSGTRTSTAWLFDRDRTLYAVFLSQTGSALEDADAEEFF